MRREFKAGMKEEGSTLLIVLAAILILTVMMTALLSTSERDMTDSNQYEGATTALANARSGMQAVYQQMQAQWKSSGGADSTDETTVKQDLEALPSSVMELSVWDGAPFHIDIQLDSDSDLNPPAGSNLTANYDVTVTGADQDQKITRTLTDTFTISGTIEALNYVLYTPGNLFILGSPEIDGQLSTGGKVYFDSLAWDAEDVVSQKTPVVVAGYYETWLPEPSNDEPSVLPKFRSNPAISSLGLYSFTGFSDMGKNNNNPTYEFGDSRYVTGVNPITASGVNALSKYADGDIRLLPSQQSLPSDYVQSIVASKEAEIKQEAQAIQNGSHGHSSRSLGTQGGYIGGSVDINDGNLTVNGDTYIDGDLTIDSGANVQFTNPLFVNGKLTINGTFSSNAVVYTAGDVYVNDVPPQTSRLELYSNGNISLSANEGEQYATQYTTFNAFLASAQNIYMGGMPGMYHIIGGLSGSNVVLNGVSGKSQRNSEDSNCTNWLLGICISSNSIDFEQSTNFSDTTPRLWITYDNSYVTNPLTGTPTLSNLTLQPMPQPTAKSGS